ncbi:MAG: hypothetical protein ACYC7J_20770 [Syntrophales bacterium]
MKKGSGRLFIKKLRFVKKLPENSQSFLIVFAILVCLIAVTYLPAVHTIDLKVEQGAISHEISYCYQYQVKGLPWGDTVDRPTASNSVVKENDIILGPGHTQHHIIRTYGKGAYSHWGNTLYFAASDNSDPRTNGRVYQISSFRTWIPPMRFILGLCVILLVFVRFNLFCAVYGLRNVILRPKTLLLISYLLVITAFILIRLPWLLDFRLPFIQYDTQTYFESLRQAASGQFPIFDMRTPGYPMFLGLTLAICPRLMFVVTVQTGLSLASMLFFLYAIYSTSGWLVIFAAIAMVAHAVQPLLSSHDFFLLTESLFTSCFLFSFGFLLLGTRWQRSSLLSICSILVGYAILVRPAGIWLLGCLLLGVVYLAATRSKKINIFCLALPAPTMILALMVYNCLTFNNFSLSSIGNLTRFAITATFWEPDPAFSTSMNDAIRAIRSKISDEEKLVLAQSWDPSKLNPIYTKWTYYVCYHSPEINKVRNEICREHFLPHESINRIDQVYKVVAKKAVIEHPINAVKFVWTTMALFLADAKSYSTSLYSNVEVVAYQMYVEGTAKDQFIGREYSTFPLGSVLKEVETPQGKRIQIDSKRVIGRNLYERIFGLARTVFDAYMWKIAYYIGLMIGLWRVLKTHFQHWGSVVYVAINISLLAAGVVVALTTTITNRYPSPTRFIEVLTMGLLPLLWQQTDKLLRNKK